MNVTESRPGKVFIVGAGPGAVELITLRGLRALREADVVLYDALVNPELLSEAPAAARKVFVGKRCGSSSMDQRDINRRMVEEARAGSTVVRLKGGDPLIFGRGGEEALACEEAGLLFEFVPGVSSALGAASYAGIPLTHRGVASSVAFITARDGSGNEAHQGRLAALASSAETLVIFMGGSRLSGIAESLVAAGIPSSASVAVVSNATRGDQRTVLGTIGSIAREVAKAQLPAPMLIIVGEVTNLSPALNWFENGARCREEHLRAALAEGGA